MINTTMLYRVKCCVFRYCKCFVYPKLYDNSHFQLNYVCMYCIVIYMYSYTVISTIKKSVKTVWQRDL